MITKITYKSFLLFYFFVVLLIFDMLNGFLVTNKYISTGGIFSPSQLGRVIGTAILVYYCYLFKVSKLWIIPLFYLVLVELISSIWFSNSIFAFTYGIVTAYKIIYLYLLSLVFIKLFRESFDLITFIEYFKLNLTIVGISLIIATMTGLGTDTYTGGGLGVKGFFSSGNALGFYLGSGLLILLAIRRTALNVKITTKHILFLCFCTIIVGTKTAIIFSLVTVLILLYESKYKYVLVLSLFFILYFYFNYLLKTLSELFTVLVFRFENAPSIISFIASGRLEYVTNAIDTFFSQDNSWLRILFGSGAFVSFRVPSESGVFDTLETDIFDVLFMYGLVGCIVFSVTMMWLVYWLRVNGIFFIVAVLLVLHSFIAGHVLFNGMSSTLIAILYLLSQNKNKIRTCKVSCQ